MTTKNIILLCYAAYLVVLSIATFIAYAADKNKAKKGKWRVPEKVLLLMSFLGGAYGGYTAMLTLRHKTTGEHWYFTFVNILGLLIHTALVICILFVFKF